MSIEAIDIDVLREERKFLRELGWHDPEIAERLGICWDTYRNLFRKHPELGPIDDPREQEREYAAGWEKVIRPQRNAVRRRRELAS